MQIAPNSSFWGRRALLLMISLGAPLALSAATIPIIDLGPGNGVITFGINPSTVALASGSITGSGLDKGVTLPWTVTTSPSSVFDLIGGNVQESVTNQSMTFNVHDSLGDSISGSIVTFGSTPDFFTYTPDGTGGNFFTGTVLVQSASEGFLFQSLGLTPASLNGTDLTLSLHIDCGTDDPCIAAEDPTGSIIDAKIGPAAPSAVPEPSLVFLLGGALVALPLLRRRRQRAA
jgi:hypothetical protein